MYEALTAPDRDPARRWLKLAADEHAPSVVEAQRHDLVIWSSLWPQRPDALVRFDVSPDAEGERTDLMWTLLVEEPEPAPALLGHLRKRINELVNADLRYSFGQ